MNKTLQNTIRKQNLLKQLFFRNYSKKGDPCKNPDTKKAEDCKCPEPPPSKYIEEKKCFCCFEEWEPKSRKQIIKQIKEETKEKKPRKCYPGMVIRKPAPVCKSQSFDPFKKKPCIEDKEPPPQQAETASSVPKDTIPQADWDHNC